MAFQPLRSTPNFSLKSAKVCHFSAKTGPRHLNLVPNKRRNTKEVLTRAHQRLEGIQQTAMTFFLTDLDVAMTLIRIANDAPRGSEKRSRNQANARHAYDEVSRISRCTVLPENDRNGVEEKLAELRSALQMLGEEFV